MIEYNTVGSTEKQKNILMVLNEIVLKQEVSTTEIAKATHLSFATISRALNMLRRAGIVKMAGKEITDMGRHPDIFGINAEYGSLLHFHMDTDSVHGILADFCGNVRATCLESIDQDITPLAFGRLLRRCAENLAGNSEKKYGKVMAAGIAIPGLVDEKNAVVRRIPNFSNFKNVNLFRYAQDALEKPVIINNEARLCAMGEFMGEYKDKGDDTIVYIDFTKYSGIGAGIIVNGQLFSGKNGFAGEMGDMLVDIRNFDSGYSEEEGCLEAMAGISVMFRKLLVLVGRGRAGILKELMMLEGVDKPTLRMVETAVLMQDLDVMDVFDETMKMWAVSVVNLSAMLDPDAIIFGGAVSRENDVVLARIRHFVSKVLSYEVNITAVEEGDQSQMLGGLYMLKKYVLNHMVAGRLFSDDEN